MQGIFIIISAPSGAGKTSIYREFLKIYPEVKFSISHTTRPPRPDEVDGRDYHFVSEQTFRELIDRGEFVEWEENFGYLYGTSGLIMNGFLNDGRDVLLDIDTRGAKRVKARLTGGIYVFVLPASQPELENRLRGRGDNPILIRQRVARAAAEIAEVAWYDYVIINEDLPLAVDNLCAIYVAEKSKRDRMTSNVEHFLRAIPL